MIQGFLCLLARDGCRIEGVAGIELDEDVFLRGSIERVDQVVRSYFVVLGIDCGEGVLREIVIVLNDFPECLIVWSFCFRP